MVDVLEWEKRRIRRFQLSWPPNLYQSNRVSISKKPVGPRKWCFVRGVDYRAQEGRVGVLTFPEARPITGWIRGTGRRRYNIVDGSVDLLLDWRGSDSGIDLPGCAAQGWLETRRLMTGEKGLFLSADPTAW
jgi:hypothetical protein